MCKRMRWMMVMLVVGKRQKLLVISALYRELKGEYEFIAEPKNKAIVTNFRACCKCKHAMHNS